MSTIKLNKGDMVKLSDREYEVILVGKSQATLKDSDGKQRRIIFASPAFKKLEVLSTSEVEDEVDEVDEVDETETDETETKSKRRVKKTIEKTAPKKRLDSKTEEAEQIVVDFEALEKESFDILEEIEKDNAEHFVFPDGNKITSWWFTIQRATKAQRIGYIQWKLEKEGNDSLFGLMLALYKTRLEVKVNYEDFESRVLIDEVYKGQRLKNLQISKVLEAVKPLINVSRNKVKQEDMDELIRVIPDDKYQGWCFYFLNQFAIDSGSLKLSVQDLNNIKIPMA